MKGFLQPTFTNAAIFNRIDQFERNKLEKMYQSLCYIGTQFSNNARSTRTYMDDTRNLRGSIGYIVGFNGTQRKINLKGTSEGKAKAREVASEILSQNTKGFVLICFAGMEYAAALESKGYDVITGSVPVASLLLKEIKQHLKAA